jgi:hypothetical protein
MLLAEGKKGAAALLDKLTQEKEQMEEWFADKKIDLPSGQDLKDMASKYLGSSDAEEEPPGEEAVPVTASPLPEVPAEAAKSDPTPAPKPKPKPVEKPAPKPVPSPKPYEKPPKPVPSPKPNEKPPKPVPSPKPNEKPPKSGTVVAMAETDVPSPKPYEKPPKRVVKPRSKPNPGSKSKPANTSEVRGRELLKKGVKHWKVSTEALQKGNRSKEQRELKASKQYFDKALKELTAASEKDPGNHKLQDLLVDCNRFRYDCLKRTIVNAR